MKLTEQQIVYASRYMAMSNLALLESQPLKSVEDVKRAWYNAGMLMMDSGLSESEIDKALEDERKYWAKLLKRADSFSVQRVQHDLPFLFN